MCRTTCDRPSICDLLLAVMQARVILNTGRCNSHSNTALTPSAVQAKDEEAKMSSGRAETLQQLAASSAVLSEASQLTAAAQHCNTTAAQAAQIALLARAEAARLSDSALHSGTALQSPVHKAADVQVR